MEPNHTCANCRFKNQQMVGCAEWQEKHIEDVGCGLWKKEKGVIPDKTPEQDLLYDCFNQFAYESFDKQGRCWLYNGGLSTLEALMTYLVQAGVIQVDKRGMYHAKHRDHHKCPKCKKLIPVGLWNMHTGKCYNCHEFTKLKTPVGKQPS